MNDDLTAPEETLFRLYTLPEIVEFPRIEERYSLGHLTVPHEEVPSVGVSIGQTIGSGSGRVEQGDDYIPIGVNSTNGRHKRRSSMNDDTS
jgi:hypothetical protein